MFVAMCNIMLLQVLKQIFVQHFMNFYITNYNML